MVVKTDLDEARSDLSQRSKISQLSKAEVELPWTNMEDNIPAMNKKYQTPHRFTMLQPEDIQNVGLENHIARVSVVLPNRTLVLSSLLRKISICSFYTSELSASTTGQYWNGNFNFPNCLEIPLKANNVRLFFFWDEVISRSNLKFR